MKTRVFEMGKNGGLVPLLEKFTDLKNGTMIEWGGNVAFPVTRFCILRKNEGDWGVSYDCFNVDKPEVNALLQRVEARSIRLEDDPELWHSQHYFIQPEIANDETVASYLLQHYNQKKAFDQRNSELQAEADALEATGRELWPSLLGDCPAVIVAEKHHNDSDGMTDYYGSHITKRVILASSSHKRDIFSEMRKAAALLPETKHLSTPPAKPADADDYWKPEDEHREKYSMGAGYYLSDAGTYSGWHIEKHVLWKNGPSREDYICLAKYHDHLNKTTQKPEAKPEAVNTGEIEITKERNWTWIKFPCKPAENVIEILKDTFHARWSQKRLAWYITSPVEIETLKSQLP